MTIQRGKKKSQKKYIFTKEKAGKIIANSQRTHCLLCLPPLLRASTRAVHINASSFDARSADDVYACMRAVSVCMCWTRNSLIFFFVQLGFSFPITYTHTERECGLYSGPQKSFGYHDHYL